MLTNLLGKPVIYNNTEGVICTVYTHEGFLFVAIVDKNGNITDNISASHCVINEQRNYQVFLFYPPHKRIMAIKTIREIACNSLKEAKELTDDHSGKVVLKTDLTYDEAINIKKIVESNGLECEIYKLP